MTLIDSNILIDILSGDPLWAHSSMALLAERAAEGPIVINEISKYPPAKPGALGCEPLKAA